MDNVKIILEAIGQRIRSARLEKNMSQEDLAFETKIGVSNISDIERGKANFRVTSLIAICTALEISSDSLIRPDLPHVNDIYQTEFASLLSDCSPTEMETILKFVKNLKETLRANN